VSVDVCVCVRARARERVCVYVCVRVCACDERCVAYVSMCVHVWIAAVCACVSLGETMFLVVLTRGRQTACV
jgi:hypothetical protein